MYSLKDNHNRFFSYLRLSITELCNFQCKYCLPNNLKYPNKNYLTLNEINNLIIAFTELGVNKIRITGGEPTLRHDFVNIGKLLSSFNNIKSVVFTSNGYKLSEIITDVVNAGYTGVNISLDSLNEKKFNFITNRKYFNKVFEGILYALKSKLTVKINIVLSDLFSLDDFEDFYSFIKYKNITIRFINQMETNTIKKKFNFYLNLKFLLNFLKNNNWILKKSIYKGSSGPALVFNNTQFLGEIGIINPYSNSFCLSCNRLRISPYGELFLCLFGGKSYSVRHLLDSCNKKDMLKQFLIDKIKFKSYSHFLDDNNFGKITSFSSIGG